MAYIEINYNICYGKECADCVNICPMEVLKLIKDKVEIVNIDSCSLCEICMDICSTNAISVHSK
ncbi:MAG: 4Fe-4S binding protein [Methanobacteriaceae archaeon]|nr:4Fe-4S binding protein [Methanobacteriaceae archaeon]